MAVTRTGLTDSYGELLTAKLQTYLAETPVEQGLQGNALLDHLMKVNKHSVSASNRYTVPVSFIEAAKGGFYDGADVTSTAGSDDVTIAHYDHVFQTEPVKLLRTEMKKNADAMFDLLVHKTRQARLRARNKFANAIMQETKVSKGPETVPLAIPEDGGASTAFGGITATGGNDGWLSKYKDASDTFANSVADFEEVSYECTKDGLTDWSYIVTTPTVIRGMKAEARSNQAIDIGARPASGRFADTGYTGVTFEGKPVFADRHLEDGKAGGDSAYFIADESLYLQCDPSDDFVIEGPFPLQGGGQHGALWNVYFGGQLIVEERGNLGVVFDVTG